MRRFFTILFFCFYIVTNSQKDPWGVSGCSAWFKTVTNNKKDFHWKDYGGDNFKLEDGGKEYSTKNVRYINFHAGLYISSKEELQTMMEGTGLSQGTVFTVFMADKGFDEERNLYAISGLNKQGFLVTNDNVKGYNGSTKELLNYGEEFGRDLKYVHGDNLEGSIESFKHTSTRILTYEGYTASDTGVWAGRESSLSLGKIEDKTGNFEGYVPEILIFSRVLNPKERRSVESYLALKYGITLDEDYLGLNDYTEDYEDYDVLWDVKKNKLYNHRVTGIVKNEEGALYQPFSTSSYDDTVFSFMYDSYDEALSLLNNKNVYDADDVEVPRRRLLYIGEGYKYKILEEEDYSIWGDNAKTLFVKKPNNVGGLYLMDRKWKLQTNVKSFPKMTSVSWDLKGLLMQYDEDNIRVEEVYNIEKSKELGEAITKSSLLEYNGELHMKRSGKGHVFLCFGSKENRDTNYGVEIDLDNGLYAIEQGKRGEFLGAVSLGSEIVVVKEKDKLHIQKNGKELAHIIPIMSKDQEKAFYGKLGMYRKTHIKGPKIKDLFTKGFSRSGMEMQLSYLNTRAKLFHPKELEKIGYLPYLIIDKTGKGDFSRPESLEYVPFRYRDELRFKLVFDHFVFDRDVSGSDVFTFGFKKVKGILAYLEFEKPSCDLLIKGSVSVKLEGGKAPFSYELTGVGATKYKGDKTSVLGREFIVKGLVKGKYRLKISGSKGKTLTKEFRLYGVCETEEEEPLITNLDDLKEKEDVIIKEEKEPFSPVVDTDNSITVFPNPVGKNIPFWVSVNVQEAYTLSIYDASGRFVAERKRIPKNNLDKKTAFKLDAIGTYYIKVTMGTGKEYYKKIVIY